MGVLYDMQAFYRWLNDASDTELLQRRQSLLDLLPQLTQEEVIQEARRLLRIIEEELLARQIRP
jgi:hypothetical protein